ncbi:unnamed protein product, partial [marine sediment metagenome]
DSIEKLRSMTKNLGILTYHEIPVMVTYHPSALLRTAWRKVGAKEDFRFLQVTYRQFQENEYKSPVLCRKGYDNSEKDLIRNNPFILVKQ